MRTPLVLAALVALATPALVALATPAFAAPLEMANGYGAIDAPRDITPEQLGRLFCAARLGGDMATLAPYFAEKLATLVTEAAATGTPVAWQGTPDTPDACSVSILNGYDDTVGVLVAVAYTAGARHWTDTLNLERTPESWRLNNIFYGGGGNLRFRLMGALP
jgi:hypothetical protein